MNLNVYNKKVYKYKSTKMFLTHMIKHTHTHKHTQTTRSFYYTVKLLNLHFKGVFIFNQVHSVMSK